MAITSTGVDGRRGVVFFFCLKGPPCSEVIKSQVLPQDARELCIYIYSGFDIHDEDLISTQQF